MKAICMALVFSALSAQVFSAPADGNVALPGEDGRKAALAPDPFPDRMSAYVWRNWGLVEADRLADVVEATKGQLADIAAEMGLAPATPPCSQSGATRDT